MSRRRSIVLRVVYPKPRKLQWWRNSDALPDPDKPRVQRSAVLITKRKGLRGEVRVVITGKPQAIRALTNGVATEVYVREALDLEFTRG